MYWGTIHLCNPLQDDSTESITYCTYMYCGNVHPCCPLQDDGTESIVNCMYCGNVHLFFPLQDEGTECLYCLYCGTVHLCCLSSTRCTECIIYCMLVVLSTSAFHYKMMVLNVETYIHEQSIPYFIHLYCTIN